MMTASQKFRRRFAPASRKRRPVGRPRVAPRSFTHEETPPTQSRPEGRGLRGGARRDSIQIAAATARSYASTSSSSRKDSSVAAAASDAAPGDGVRSSAGAPALRRGMKGNVIAPAGHTSLHLPHLEQSGMSLICGSSSSGQASTQA